METTLVIWGIEELFYSDIRILVLLIPLWFQQYNSAKHTLLLKKERQFEQQFHDALQSMEAQLSTGYSMENAVKEVQKELQLMYASGDMITREFTYMTRQLNLNMTIEEVWKEFAERVNLSAVDSFVTVFIQAKRSGGDSIKIIRNTIHVLRERAGMKLEMDTVIAAKKLEFRIMTMIPFGIIAYMRVSFPEFMSVLYGDIFGKCFMTVCLLIYLVACKIGNQIVEIEV